MNQPARAVYYLDARVVARNSEKAADLISFALVSPAGNWYYVEVQDFDKAACDEFALTEVIPRLQRVPGVRFLKVAAIASDVSAWLIGAKQEKIGPAGVELRYMSQDAHPAHRLISEAMMKICKVVSIERAVDEATFIDYQKHCDGRGRTAHHALINAMGYAICDTARTEPASLHESSILHLEYIMGSKSAVSYRAWARAFERKRDDAALLAQMPVTQ